MKKEYDFSAAKRGAILPGVSGKTRITIRLDNEILAWFREQTHAAEGGNYQTLINEALKDYIRQRPESLEQVMRRVVREEIRKATPKSGTRKVA